VYQLVFAPNFVKKTILSRAGFYKRSEEIGQSKRCKAKIESKAKEIVYCAHTEMLTIFFVVWLNCIPKSVAKLSGRQAPVRL